VTEGKSLPQESGIYFVISAEGDLLYVGSSSDIRQRWRCHQRKAKALEMGCGIAWILHPMAGLRARETELIRELQPKWNGIRNGIPGDMVKSGLSRNRRRVERVEPQDRLLNPIGKTEERRTGTHTFTATETLSLTLRALMRVHQCRLTRLVEAMVENELKRLEKEEGVYFVDGDFTYNRPEVADAA
jgi:hypothetical protein